MFVNDMTFKKCCGNTSDKSAHYFGTWFWLTNNLANNKNAVVRHPDFPETRTYHLTRMICILVGSRSPVGI